MPRPNRHNEIELNLLSAGSLTYLLEVTVQRFRPAGWPFFGRPSLIKLSTSMGTLRISS